MSRWTTTNLSAWLLMAAAFLLGCGLSAPARTDGAPPGSLGPSSYPPARWRLADPRELETAMVWFSHLVIAHRDADPFAASFELPDWRPRAKAPTRARRQARQLAQTLSERATRDTFAGLARRWSDDETTRERGGYLGGWSALQLADWPEVLDALSALEPGRVSRVVETEFGFHVLQRHAPPAEETIGGERLVLAYDSAPWLHRFLAWRAVPRRSREDALALASQLLSRLREHPEEFADLVERHSDHRDALRGGDFGEWSTHEPTPFPRELAALAETPVGAVVGPVDTAFGIQLLRRAPLRERTLLSASKLRRSYQPEAPDDSPSSRATVTRELEALMGATPRTDGSAERFTALQARECCVGTSSWWEGRGSPYEERLLAATPPGQIAHELVVDENTATLLWRRSGTPPTAKAVRFDLPAPTAVDLEFWVARQGNGELLTAARRRLSAASTATESGETATWVARLSELERAMQPIASVAGAPAKRQWVRRMLAAVEEQLGTPLLMRYRRAIVEEIEARLLRGREGLPLRDPGTGLPFLARPHL